MWACGFEHARAVRNLVCMPCFVLERGVWILALMSWVWVSCRGLDTRAPCFVSFCEHAVSSSLGRVLFCPRVVLCCVCCFVRLDYHVMFCALLCGTSFCFSLAACFHVIMSCLNTWLMSFLISYMFVSCFAHGLWFVCWPCACNFVLCEHMAFVLVFSVSCALIHLVTWLLVNLPHLSSFVTLLICSLYNLLVFAVLRQFGIVSPWMYSALPCPALPCPALPCPVLSCPVLSCPVLSCPVLSCPVLSCPVLSCPVLSCPVFCLVPVFPPRGSFCCCFCFILLIKAHLLHHLVLASSLQPWHK